MKTEIKKGQWIKYNNKRTWYKVSKVSGNTIIVIKENEKDTNIIILDIKDITKIGKDTVISTTDDYITIDHRSLKSIKQLLTEYNCTKWLEGCKETEIILIK
jgi:ribosomal silencing factor RsfS